VQQQQEEIRKSQQFKARPFDPAKYRDIGIRRTASAQASRKSLTAPSPPSFMESRTSPGARDHRRRYALDSHFTTGQDRRDRMNQARSQRMVRASCSMELFTDIVVHEICISLCIIAVHT
jgi:hypothetical protein